MTQDDVIFIPCECQMRVPLHFSPNQSNAATWHDGHKGLVSFETEGRAILKKHVDGLEFQLIHTVVTRPGSKQTLYLKIPIQKKRYTWEFQFWKIDALGGFLFPKIDVPGSSGFEKSMHLGAPFQKIDALESWLGKIDALSGLEPLIFYVLVRGTIHWRQLDSDDIPCFTRQRATTLRFSGHEPLLPPPLPPPPVCWSVSVVQEPASPLELHVWVIRFNFFTILQRASSQNPLLFRISPSVLFLNRRSSDGFLNRSVQRRRGEGPKAESREAGKAEKQGKAGKAER